MVLKVIILVWSLIPFGSAFQVLGADALNDLSPNVDFVRDKSDHQGSHWMLTVEKIYCFP